VTTVVRSGHPHDRDVDRLRSRLAELEAAHRERVAELGRLKADLAAFKARYREEVGLLHEELDALEQAIAEAEAGVRARNAEAAAGAGSASPASPRPDLLPRLTSDAVRRLFRDVAKTIHPDLASDEVTRDRRHALMIEANRAYAMGDEERLRWVLEAWEKSPEAVPDSDPEAARLRLARRVAQLEEQLEMCAGEMTVLRDTPLYKLKAMVDEAAARGKDLVDDAVRRLKRDILAARNRLDAMQSHR
jgi:hypothetical protein